MENMQTGCTKEGMGQRRRGAPRDPRGEEGWVGRSAWKFPSPQGTSTHIPELGVHRPVDGEKQNTSPS